MSDFTCNNVGSQPWFGNSNNYRKSNGCVGAPPVGFRGPPCFGLPVIKGMFVDVNAIRQPYQLSQSYNGQAVQAPMLRVSIQTALKLDLFYQNDATGTLVYKSDVQIYNSPDNLKKFSLGNSSTSTAPNCIGGCNAGIGFPLCFSSQFTGDYSAIFGPQAFDYTVYAIACYTPGGFNSLTSLFFTYYILYTNVKVYDFSALDGFFFASNGCTLNLTCPNSQFFFRGTDLFNIFSCVLLINYNGVEIANAYLI